MENFLGLAIADSIVVTAIVVRSIAIEEQPTIMLAKFVIIARDRVITTTFVVLSQTFITTAQPTTIITIASFEAAFAASIAILDTMD